VDKPLFSENWYRVRALTPALRSHVKLHRQVQGDEVWYMLEDAASGRFHRFNTSAYHVIALMNGSRTVEEIWEEANTALGDDGPVQDEVIQLLGQLHRIDVLRTNIPPDVAELLDRRKQERKARRLGRIKSPLSIRLPLADPDRFLDAALPLVRWCFSPAVFYIWLLLVVLATALAAVNWPALAQTARLEALNPDNLLLLLLVYPFVKLVHELGHAFAAKLEGGEVHEIGVIFMVFVPVPYVDASAATAFSSRRKRILVGAIGVMVELLLAALALFAWLNISDGLLSSLCFTVMLIGGVSTLFFNGNPLLRFDGYYVLADLLGIPNFAQRSNAFYAYLIQRYGFGLETANSPAHSRREAFWFSLYAPLSLAYRLGILFVVCLFLLQDLFVVGAALALWAVTTQVLWPLLKHADFVLLNPRLRRHRTRALWVSTLALGAFTAVMTLWPVASLSSFQGVIYPPEQSRLTAGTEGFVSQLLVDDGAPVSRGQPIARLENIFHEAEREALESQLRELNARYTAARTQDRVQAKLAREEIAALEADLQRNREKREALLLTAPVDGVFLRIPDSDLEGRYLERGSLLGYVVPSTAATARVVVVQDELDLIQSRLDAIEVRMASDPWQVYRGSLKRSVPQASFSLPSPVLSTRGGGRFITRDDDPLALASGERVFEFEIALPEVPADTRIGTRVHVRFDHGAEPLAAQWYRDLQQLLLRRLPG
jgi:putative peptide zinc metalloprotease protein